METNGTKGKTIQSTQTAFDIVETLAEEERLTITEIADQVEYSRSTVHYHLKTLQQGNYVIKDDHGFRLGLRMARLGELALRNHRLSGLVETVAEDLANEVNAVAHVAVQEGNKLIWLYRSSSGDGSDYPTEVGTVANMHCTAYGQAIMAYSDTETVDRLIDASGLSGETDATLTERDALDERLAAIHDLGFAYSVDEYRNGISSIAAPIVDEDEDVVAGAIGITDSTNRIDDPYKHTKARRFSDEKPDLVQQAARIAGEKLTDS